MAWLLAYRAALLTTGLLGSAAFTYIALLLHRLRRLTGGPVEPVAGFLLLALSHAWVIVEALASSPRLAYTGYTGAASASLAGLLLLLASTRPPGASAAALAPLLLLPGALDASAALAAAYASAARFRGPARAYMVLYAAGHAARSLGAVLLPSPIASALVAVGELLRSTMAAAMAAHYASAAARGA